jgi:PEP-CTERM motif
MKTNTLIGSLAVLGLTILCAPVAYATTITVQNLGSILNDSVSFPNTKTPGAGKTFEDFFEFTLPTAEYVTASMSISGPLMDQVPAGKGQLSLYTWTSTSSSSPFIPIGTLIEQAALSAPSLGGQTAVVGSFTQSGDYEQAGNYFVEIAGTSGHGGLKLAVNGNVTAVAGGVPEPSTWAMFGIGFAGLAGMGLHRRHTNRESARYAL